MISSNGATITTASLSPPVDSRPNGFDHKYQQLKQQRSASERINSSVKEDTPILRKPRVANGLRANILAQVAASVALLKRAFSFIVKITTLVRKYHRALEQKCKTKLGLLLNPPFPPSSKSSSRENDPTRTSQQYAKAPSPEPGAMGAYASWSVSYRP